MERLQKKDNKNDKKCLLRKENLQSLGKVGLRHNMKANSKYLQGINEKKKTGSGVGKEKVFQQSVQVQENKYLKIILEKRKKKVSVCSLQSVSHESVL